MNSKTLVVVILLFTAVAAPAARAYVPHVGDHFGYYEVISLGAGTGDYAGYSEQTIVNGIETINGANPDGTASASFSYSWTFSNNSGTTDTGDSAGNFTFSPVTFLYVNGTDDQTGYVNPTVWFVMDNYIPVGGTFSLLNTQMTVISKDYSYYLPSQGRNVNVIFAQGNSGYERNDVYGQFSATYSWKVYFDPSTGYIAGYYYEEHDTNPSGTGFTYTENLYVTSTSYQLTAAPATNPPVETLTPVVSVPTGGSSTIIYLTGLALLLIFIIIVVLVYALSRRGRRLPQHPYQGQAPPPSPPPENIDLTPKQPQVQQIVIKEVVKVKCRYCGALIDSTVQTCPICGAPRT